MKLEIVNKLNHFLTSDFTNKEPYVVYLLVELRKLIEWEHKSDSAKFKLVKFYTDWVLHTEKDKITDEIKQIMNQIDKLIPKDQNPFHVDGDFKFIYMPELRKELIQLLNQSNLPNEFCSDDIKWLSFVNTLIQILANQPINNPVPSIKKFTFQPSSRGLRLLKIEFNDKRRTFLLRDAG